MKDDCSMTVSCAVRNHDSHLRSSHNKPILEHTRYTQSMTAAHSHTRLRALGIPKYIPICD
jgi:hypothetical protein